MRTVFQCDDCGRPIPDEEMEGIWPHMVYAVLCEDCSPTGRVKVELLQGFHKEELEEILAD